jgi:Bacterial surface proteins containing Ig-like domains
MKTTTKTHRIWSLFALLLTASITLASSCVWDGMEGISLNKSSLVMYPGGTYTLTATVTLEDASGIPVLWESSNTEVATVSPYGTVSFRKEGNVVITAYAGTASASCSAQVLDKANMKIIRVAHGSKTHPDLGAYTVEKDAPLNTDPPEVVVAGDPNSPYISYALDGEWGKVEGIKWATSGWFDVEVEKNAEGIYVSKLYPNMISFYVTSTLLNFEYSDGVPVQLSGPRFVMLDFTGARYAHIEIYASGPAYLTSSALPPTTLMSVNNPPFYNGNTYTFWLRVRSGYIEPWPYTASQPLASSLKYVQNGNVVTNSAQATVTDGFMGSNTKALRLTTNPATVNGTITLTATFVLPSGQIVSKTTLPKAFYPVAN